MAYGDFKDLTKRIAVDKVLHDKAFKIAKNPTCDGYRRELAPMVYNIFDRETYGETVKNKNFTNKDLAEELNKPIIRNFDESKVH